MEKLLALVKALNDFDENTKVYLREDSVRVEEYDKDGKQTNVHVIKARPITGANGVETWAFVARQEKEN